MRTFLKYLDCTINLKLLVLIVIALTTNLKL